MGIIAYCRGYGKPRQRSVLRTGKEQRGKPPLISAREGVALPGLSIAPAIL